MGLDSVELLVEVEKFFDITISNQEAEHIYTVEDFAKIISKYTSFHQKESTLFDKMKLKLEGYFLDKLNTKISAESLLEDLLPFRNRQQIWTNLALYLVLDLPHLNKPDLTENYHPKNVKFLGITINTIFEKKPLLKDKSITNLVDWIIALNYKTLFNPLIINNLYEVERIIIGITSEKIGVDVNDIEVYHSFTNDLGID
jgi:acyl carrier protein